MVRASAKQYAVFNNIRNILAHKSNNNSQYLLRPLCPTRWAVRAKSLSSVVNNFDAVNQTFDTIASEGRSEFGSKAAVLMTSFGRFNMYFALKLGIAVFSKAEELSCMLQQKSITASAVCFKVAADFH